MIASWSVFIFTTSPRPLLPPPKKKTNKQKQTNNKKQRKQKTSGCKHVKYNITNENYCNAVRFARLFISVIFFLLLHCLFCYLKALVPTRIPHRKTKGANTTHDCSSLQEHRTGLDNVFTIRTSSSSSAVDQPYLDPQSTCCHELGGAAQVFRRSPQLVSGWLTLRP